METVSHCLGEFLRDVRFGLRGLARNPGFAAITAGSLALGIGGSAAMYSVIYGVILNPFAYRDVDRLVSVSVLDTRARGNGSYYPIDAFIDIAEHNTVFSGVVASTWSDVTLTGEGDPQRLRGNHCTMNTFDVMGVAPLIGRVTTPEDSAPGAAPVAVLGYRCWQRQFGGSNAVLGRQLTLNGKVRTVIGVMPPRFMWRGADVYLPDVFKRGHDVEGEREVHLLGRLKPGLTIEQAATGLQPLFQDLRRLYPNEMPEKWRLRLRTFKETFPSGITEELWILFGAVGLLLLISCVNVSSLLLSRMVWRQREIAVRSALGAGRSRLIRQLLTETLVLALAGAALGLLAAYAALHGIMTAVPPDTIPDEAEINMNLPVLGFTLLLSMAVAVITGLAPALQFSGRDIISTLREAGRNFAGGVRQRLLRNSLVVGEVALSLTLLSAATLMIRTLVAVQSADLGIRRDSILTVRIPFNRDRYPTAERRTAFLRDVLRRVSAVPGVAAVGVNSGLPPIGNWNMAVEIPGLAPDRTSVILHQVNESYPAAMGLALVHGRFLDAADIAGRVRHAVVNQAFARRYLVSRDVLGSMVTLPRLINPPFSIAANSFQIVGVVRDTLNRISTRETLPEVYIPFSIAGLADRLYVLGKTRPESLERAVRNQVYAADRGQPVTDVRTLESMLNDYVYSRPRFNLLLLSIFAGLGLTMALLGIHGIISQSVSQRTREIGIRVALGAGYSQVLAVILKLALQVLAIGIVLGLIASWMTAGLLRNIVQNVPTIDALSLTAVAVLLLITGLFASFWPARRAANVDPVSALREE